MSGEVLAFVMGACFGMIVGVIAIGLFASLRLREELALLEARRKHPTE